MRLRPDLSGYELRLGENVEQATCPRSLRPIAADILFATQKDCSGKRDRTSEVREYDVQEVVGSS